MVYCSTTASFEFQDIIQSVVSPVAPVIRKEKKREREREHEMNMNH